jgi:hypothetical protein
VEEKGGYMNWKSAFGRALDLLGKADPAVVCERAGAIFDVDGYILRYFGKDLRIVLPEGRFEPPGVSPEEMILMLHYLIAGVGRDSRSNRETAEMDERKARRGSGELISFKDLPGGMFYNRTYRRRGVEPILTVFGGRAWGTSRSE